MPGVGWGVVGSAGSKQLSRDGRRKDDSRGWGHRSSQAEGQLCTLLPTLHVQDLVKHRPPPSSRTGVFLVFSKSPNRPALALPSVHSQEGLLLAGGRCPQAHP